jgi:peptidoglycan/LPS O-acetylase OafA/YrhL
VAALAALVGRVLLAAGSFRYVEQPFLRRKQRFTRIRGRVATAGVTG